MDSQGGRGVSAVHQPGQLPALINDALRFSRKGEAIIEEYVTGPEFSINAFLKNGQVVLAVPTDRFVDMAYPCGAVIGHGLPSRIPDSVSEQAIKLVNLIAKAAFLSEGPIYCQFKHVGEEVFLIEATPRLDGCHIWRMISYMYGVDLLEASLKLVLEEECEFPAQNSPAFDELRIEFFVQRPNTPFQQPHELAKSLYTEWFYEEGDIVRAVNGYAEKTGYQIRSVHE